MNLESDQPPQHDVVDLEQYFAAGKTVPPAKKYRIRIDKQQYEVNTDHMSGREILHLAGKTPDKYLLRQKVAGNVEEVEADEVVSFLRPGVERFMTIPNEVTEGDSPSVRLQFPLLADDAEFLASLGSRWEAVVENGVKVIVIYDWELPHGYGVSAADVHLRLTDGYPDVQIDMAYFAPPLTRADRKGINGLSELQFDGRTWQQWSRHRTAASQWRAGEDNLSTHLAVVRKWLIAELRK
jgi:hypothetical protein